VTGIDQRLPGDGTGGEGFIIVHEGILRVERNFVILMVDGFSGLDVYELDQIYSLNRCNLLYFN
jgi:hypothetical protein